MRPSTTASSRNDEMKQPATTIVGERAVDGTITDRDGTTFDRRSQVRAVNDRMAASSLPTLTVMRERVWQTVSKVLKRGKCRTDGEYYLVIEGINGVSDLTLSTEERERLGQIVAVRDASETVSALTSPILTACDPQSLRRRCRLRQAVGRGYVVRRLSGPCAIDRIARSRRPDAWRDLCSPES